MMFLGETSPIIAVETYILDIVVYLDYSEVATCYSLRTYLLQIISLAWCSVW